MMIPRKQNLMKRMLKRAARARGQHGIALLFTLCILSMALITAMILSSGATTSRKVAAVQVDSTAARILADGVVGRAVLALMHSNAAYACSNYKTLPPKNGNSGVKPKEYASDWIWKLEKNGVFTFNKGPIRFKSTYYAITESLCPSWEYVYDIPYGVTGSSNERIFGRYAYVAIGQNDQLNPNAIGKRDYSDYDDAVRQKRLGRYTCEPEFIFKSARNGWDYDTNSPVISPMTIVNKYTAAGWDEQDLFANALLGSTEDKSARMMLDQYFDVSGKAEYNKFSPTGKAVAALSKHDLSGDEKYRFPLIRTDWNTIEVADVRSAIPWFGNSSNAAVNQTIANFINYNARFDRSPLSDADWRTGEPTYTGNKRTPYINEVSGEVAIGGTLGFRIPKKDVDSDPNDPTNPLKWRIMYTDCSYSHDITVHVETVNMFNGYKTSLGGADDGYSAFPVNTPVLFGGEVSYEYWIQNPNNAAGGAGSWKKITVPFEKFSTDTDVSVTKNGSDDGYQDYTFVLKSGPIDSFSTPWLDNNGYGYDKPMGHDADFYRFMRIKNVKVNLDRIILYDTTGRNADLALMPDTMRTGKTFFDGGTDEDEIACGLGDFRKRVYLHAQVNDPRFNLARNQWTDGANQFLSEDFLADTIRAKNDVATGTYHDNEDKSGYDPAYNNSNPISTAYIRHNQMDSLWELGAVHRGAPWQTINLKCAKNDANTMGPYENGDGHLLDQIALTSRTDNSSDTVIGMINLNCVANFGNAPFTFKSLFTNFPIYRTFANMNDNNPDSNIEGEAVDSENSGADVYAAELSAGVACAVANGFAPRRTAVLPESFPAGSANPMTRMIPTGVPDAQSEEIFCRVVNLLKWNKQQTKRATILVLAQTIQDVGGDVSLSKVLPKAERDLMRDAGFMAFYDDSKRTTDLSLSNVSANSTRTVKYKYYDNFYDQITGEAKLIVHMEWDESAFKNEGGWKITRKEYAE